MINQREKAYKVLRDAFTYGQFRPGERLVESYISEKFKIGRTPVREAFRQLQMEEYIEILPNKGAFIKKFSDKDIEEIYDVLAIMEGFATQVATNIIKSSDEKKLNLLQNQLKNFARNKEYKNWLETNSEFHNLFVKRAGNKQLYNIVNTLRKKIYRYRFIALTHPSDIEGHLKFHEKIIKAISKRSSKQAGSIMKEHVLNVKKILIESLERYPHI